MQTELNHIGGALGRFSAHVETASGMCEVHGTAEVLVRKGAAWHCPKCLEAKMAAETDLLWVTARRADLLAAATIPAKFLEQRFIATTELQRAVRRQAKLFSDFILKNRAWAALILVGKTGTGKTLLACELAQALMHSAARSVRYITAAGMISEIQATYSQEGKSQEGEIQRFVQFDVLILDEIDAIRNTENASLLLTEIINRRYNENKPVITISNQPFDHLARFVGERVHSRLHENSFSCALNWEDARRVRAPAASAEAAA